MLLTHNDLYLFSLIVRVLRFLPKRWCVCFISLLIIDLDEEEVDFIFQVQFFF